MKILLIALTYVLTIIAWELLKITLEMWHDDKHRK